MNNILNSLGFESFNIYSKAKEWPVVMVLMKLWKSTGYGTVVYLAAIVGISPEIYEAAKIDGANIWQRITSITIPCLKPTIITMLLLSVGGIFRGDFGMFYQLVGNNQILLETSDILDTFVYRSMMSTSNMGMSLMACGAKEEANIEQEAVATAGQIQDANAGISEDSPYRDKGFDLSKHEEIALYAVGERPQDMDMVLEKLNKEYLNPWLNSTLKVEFISWGDLGTKYSLLLSGGEKVDLMYTSSWCNYNSEVGNGAFKELTPEFLQTYLPYSYEQQAPESWDQVSISGKIYANGQRGSNEFGDHLWWQHVGADALASGYDFMYYTNEDGSLPEWDKDVFYKYTSEVYLKLYLEMAEMAAHNVWSPTRINDTSDQQVNFESGKSASIIWNSAAVSTGKKMEDAGVGTFAVYDVTPDAKARRDSYANDMMAIPASSQIPERAALVLDCIKGFPEVNNLVMGGVEGVHYNVTEDGKRTPVESADAYPWGAWAWGIPGRETLGEYSMQKKKCV